jgi:hypothetical protein
MMLSSVHCAACSQASSAKRKAGIDMSIMNGIRITRVDEKGRKTELNLGGLTIGDRRCRDMSQIELFRAMRNLVPGIDATMGHQALMERLCEHYANAAA